MLQVALGIRCNVVTIVPDYDDCTAGSSTHGGEYSEPGEGLGEPDDAECEAPTAAGETAY